MKVYPSNDPPEDLPWPGPDIWMTKAQLEALDKVRVPLPGKDGEWQPFRLIPESDDYRPGACVLEIRLPGVNAVQRALVEIVPEWMC